MTMTDPILDPITGAGQATNPQTQPAEPHQDIFWWSSDVFNNPDMFQAVPEAAPAPKHAEDDFHLDLDQLEANQHTSAPIEPIVIEPPVEHQETFEEYQARQNPPQPEIIEQIIEPAAVIEPEMKSEVKVNPRKQPVQAPAKPVAPVQAPAPKPQVQAQPKPTVVEPQMKPEVKVNPRKQPVQAPVQAPVQTPKPVQAPAPKPQATPQPRPQVQAPAPKPPVAPVQVVKAPEIQSEPKPEPKPVAPAPHVETTPQNTPSDLQKKLNELITTAHTIYALEKKNTDEVVELLWANNDKVTILYQITLPENGITIKKIETDLDTEEEMVNDLWFVLENTSVQILLDDVLLFDELEDLQDDPKKKMQVTEKLNKFIFLLSEQQKKIEKEAKEKEEAEQERRRLQDIFRNF